MNMRYKVSKIKYAAVKNIEEEIIVNNRIFISQDDIDDINRRFCSMGAKYTAFSILCYSKMCDKKQVFIPTRLLFYFTGISIDFINKHYLIELVDFGYLIRDEDEPFLYTVISNIGNFGEYEISPETVYDFFDSTFTSYNGKRARKTSFVDMKHNYDNRGEYKSICNQKRNSQKRNIPNSLTLREWEACKSYFDNKCAYCGEEDKLCKEHVVPFINRGGYTKENILPSCTTCNSSKNSRHIDDWYPNYKYYSKERHDKIDKYFKLIKEGEMPPDSD